MNKVISMLMDNKVQANYQFKDLNQVRNQVMVMLHNNQVLLIHQ